METITIFRATNAEVELMSTLEVRSFHPVNPYHKACFPDTPVLQQWWCDLYQAEIDDPTCQPLVAISTIQKDLSKAAVGVLLLRHFKDSGGDSLMVPLTNDHDKERLKPMLEGQNKHRAEIMGDSPHFMVEYFAIDHEFKGRGIGKALLKRATEVADKDGLNMFVEANMFSTSFYANAGFVLEREITMPGPEEYRECLMVRKAKSS